VTGDDYARIGDDDAERYVTFLGNQAFMRIARNPGRASHCAALVIRDGVFTCAIYEKRPQVCRDLERESSACEGERDVKGPRRLSVLKS